MARRALALIAACIAATACNRNPTPPGERITGRERIAWDQQATDAAELATFRYAIYVDGSRSELTAVTCTSAQPPFICSASLPALSPGRHAIQLASFVSDLGVVESSKSGALQVQVAAQVAGAVRVQARLVTNDPGDADSASSLPVDTRAVSRGPSARLIAAPRLVVPGSVDSSVPLAWGIVDGVPTLFGFASWGGVPSMRRGSGLEALQPGEAVTLTRHPGHGVWIDSVIPDEVGAWYGYYHHEIPADVCGRPDRSVLQIGAARSFDQGHTWEDLGFVLEAPRGGEACTSQNRYVIGGVGDVSAMLDRDRQNVFLYFSQYSKDSQGVALARLAWADRDAPAGRVAVWQNGAWLPAREVTTGDGAGWDYPAGTPLVPVFHPWHDASASVDAFWGPSIHWNSYLEKYVMLVNRAKDEYFNNEGIYMSFADTLDDPRGWSRPRRILNGGEWYPQVAGLDARVGTDKMAGQRARFFMTGRSVHIIEFTK